MVSSDLRLLPLLVSFIQPEALYDHHVKALKVLSNLSDEESNHVLLSSSDLGLLPLLVDIVANQ